MTLNKGAVKYLGGSRKRRRSRKAIVTDYVPHKTMRSLIKSETTKKPKGNCDHLSAATQIVNSFSSSETTKKPKGNCDFSSSSNILFIIKLVGNDEEAERQL